MRSMLSLLLFCFLAFASPAWAGVDVNAATASELETLPGIGPSKAAAIIEYRNANGPFATVDQLDAVPGIGPATLANIRSLVVLGGGQTASTPASTETSPVTPAATVGTTDGAKVNINSATASELQQLPGIGPSKAAAIVEYRTANGPFSSCDALASVSGIGPATVATARYACTVE